LPRTLRDPSHPSHHLGALTDARGFTTWNTTVTSLEGEIALGSQLALRVKLDPKRTFRPKVTKLEPKKTMEWSDGFAPMFRGVRTFTLTPQPDGLTEFEMQEAFSGAMLPMIRKSLRARRACRASRQWLFAIQGVHGRVHHRLDGVHGLRGRGPAASYLSARGP
jgi:hypothetical protein